MRYILAILLFIGSVCNGIGQKEFTVACIAFYNLENLFDTLDSPDTDDLEFTPDGPNLYNSHVYWDKLGHLSKVIGEVGMEFTPDGPALLGVSEIENSTVLEDLIKQPAIVSRDYKIIHQDSKDATGVDFEDFYRKGLGTTAYQDAWSLFDQIILNRDLSIEGPGFHFYKAVVFNPPYLTQKSGTFKGNPLRTYANGVYAGGYSDHFPVYVLLVKAKT